MKESASDAMQCQGSEDSPRWIGRESCMQTAMWRVPRNFNMERHSEINGIEKRLNAVEHGIVGERQRRQQISEDARTAMKEEMANQRQNIMQ